ncbi:hypothetical protein PYK79_14405 [Streptomyces sp. ID05-04B]|jgi:hypothetical protein|uniref:hypothetical protein n=1 Tax=unclassified Streptomyces TaxID=2593676 RepID=UPI001C1FE8C8|nr:MULTISPECIES: hypothetical protein [unclassified Streptomyces]MDX5564284.1 hypothetical protein [Streptomyces sp. ID05-04B]
MTDAVGGPVTFESRADGADRCIRRTGISEAARSANIFELAAIMLKYDNRLKN